MNISAATWNMVSELLDEALDLEPPARAIWLEQLSSTRPELVTTVRKLLEAHAASETADVMAALPPLPVRSDAARVSALAPGDRLGPYRLKRELGSGGMADVWLAERADGAFTREVALKLPIVSRLRRDLAQRFARERDILARLEHPHIARLYDAGLTDDGLPYLAMEYVDGQPITDYCDKHQLTIDVRLKLFLQVLEAVQFAHANLIIHRDLKPSNILVTTARDVRLLDFGIAKMLADDETAQETQLTQLAGRAFTPHYASPEQIKGEPLTIATDIYSLGAVLYELLAGTRPYRLKVNSAAQLEQAIVAAEPVRASSVLTDRTAMLRGVSRRRLAQLLYGDLDTILLKTLEKLPLHRYSTIGALAEDLERYLSGRPVSARPASLHYRARKFIIRNRIAVVTGTAISLALISAAVVSWWQAQQAREQAARAEQVKSFIVSIFQNADPEVGGSRSTTAAYLLKQARERLTSKPVDDPAIAVELLTAVGTSLAGLGEDKEAEPVLEEATKLANAQLGPTHPITIAATLGLSDALVSTLQIQRAEPVVDALVETSVRLGDTPSLIRALNQKASLLMRQGRREESVVAATEAVRLAETQSHTGANVVLLRAYSTLTQALSFAYKSRLEPARRTYALAREVDGNRNTISVIRARRDYAMALMDEGDPDLGLNELKGVVSQQIELLGANHREVAISFSEIGYIFLMRGDPLTSIEFFRQGLRIDSALDGDKPSVDSAIRRTNLGAALCNARRYREAEPEFQAAHAVFTSMDTNDGSGRFARAWIALVLTRTGRLNEAEALLEQLLPNPPSAYDGAVTKLRFGILRTAQGRHAEAVAMLRESVQIYSEHSGPIPHAGALAALGAALIEDGQAEAALEPLKQADATYAKLQPKLSPDHADLLISMAQAQLRLGRIDEAVALSERAANFWRDFDGSHRHTGLALLWLARVLAAAGETSRAVDTIRLAAKILADDSLPTDRALLAETQRQLRRPHAKRQ